MTTLCINPHCPQPLNGDDRERCQGCGARLRLGHRFRPVELLGQGGFGRTVLAWDESTDPPQRCVIKQILRSSGSRQRDWDEANRLAQLGHHPQIPTLIAILESPRDICLVQAYIPGHNLEQTLTAEGPFSESQVRSLLVSLLPVLTYIHDHGIIHRDIKPENIILPGADAPPVLVDFGAARTIPSDTEREHTGTVIGSAGYAAPEQALGKAIPASDLYSLGVTCLHLLTGQHPFDLYSVAADQWLWQPYLLQPLSPSLVRILNRLTLQSLKSRYPTAAAALADLVPAGRLTLPGGSSSLALLTPSVWPCVDTWSTPGRTVKALAISQDGLALATANSDHTVQLWDRQTGEVLHTFARRFGWGDGHQDAVTTIQFHPDGHTLLTGSQDGTVKQWDLQHYRLQRTLSRGRWPITAIALTPDGQTLITAAVDGQLTIWELPQGQPVLTLAQHQGAINALALSPDGSRLASVDAAGVLRLWTVPEGQLLQTWATETPGLEAVAFSVTAPALITGDAKGQIIAWSLTDFQHYDLLSQHQDAVSAIALSTDEQWLATASRDREIRLWNWRHTPPLPLATRHHAWAVCDLCFTPDNQTLISSAADETIRFWQAT